MTVHCRATVLSVGQKRKGIREGKYLRKFLCIGMLYPLFIWPINYYTFRDVDDLLGGQLDIENRDNRNRQNILEKR